MSNLSNYKGITLINTFVKMSSLVITRKTITCVTCSHVLHDINGVDERFLGVIR